MMEFIILWSTTTIFIAVISFFVMKANYNLAKKRYSYDGEGKAKYYYYAKQWMRVSLFSPLWPLAVLVLPAMLIKYVFNTYRDVIRIEVKS